MSASERIREAHRKVGGGWRIERRKDADSSWWHAESDSAHFDRADLDQLVEVCRILSGRRKA